MVAGVVMLVVLSGCTREQWHRFPSPDDLVAAVPWFAVMHRGIAIQPYKMPLQPPEGIVPITGVEVVPRAIEANSAALARLRNPVQRTAGSIERGQERYDIYCAVCHGEGGAADGPVAQALGGVVRDLTEPRMRARTDGWLYSVITNSFGIMPEYGSKIKPEDRWHIVNYVRVLQGAAQQ